MKLYHGTSKDFDQFDDSMFCTGMDANGFSALGHFFTPDSDLADVFAGRNGRVIECEVTMNRTAELAISDLFAWDDAEGGVVLAASISDLRIDLIARGYDSAIILPATSDEDESLGLGGEFDSAQYVAFHATQITVL